MVPVDACVLLEEADDVEELAVPVEPDEADVLDDVAEAAVADEPVEAPCWLAPTHPRMPDTTRNNTSSTTAAVTASAFHPNRATSPR